MSVGEKVELTPKEFLAMPDAKNFELIDGELRERAVSTLTSLVAVRLIARLASYVEANQLGWVLDAENGYQCFPAAPRTVRKPDVSFVRAERLPVEEIGDGWTKIRPDLAVEVISPNDEAYEVAIKLEEYRSVGIPLIWVVYPPTRTVEVIRGKKSLMLNDDEELTGEEIVPGFTCRVADLFPPASSPPVGDKS